MSKIIEMTGMVFGRLTVLSLDGSSKKGRAKWLCDCECGNMVTVLGVSLRTGNTTSCGCKNAEHVASGNMSRIHGGSGTPEYRVWKSMMNRCFNPNGDDYATYGGRGITVCDRWRESFAAFLEDMGPRPSPKHSIDRFPDKNGNYEPGNCRWATMKQQQNNRRNNRMITHGGETLTITDWSKRTGLSRQIILYRLQKGWTVAESITTPSRLSGVAS